MDTFAIPCLRILFILFTSVAVSSQAYAHSHDDYDLLVMLPYEAASTNAVRDDEDWVTFGQEFAEYKTASGISADIVTMEDIKANYNGIKLERNFIIAKPDRIAPQVTVELPWSEIVKTGQLYGLVYDERFGTGVNKVRVAVNNKVKGLWLSRDGKWVDKESWLNPNEVVSFDYYIDKRLDTVLTHFPKARRKGERNRLEKLSGMLHTRRDPLVWALQLPVRKCKGKYTSGAPFDMDADIEVLVIATDYAGNTSKAVLTNSSMNAEFLATTSGSKQSNVKIQNLSAGVIADYEWDFGDGKWSNDQAPIHHYKTPGTYTVTLAVSGPNATDKVTKDVRVGRKQKIHKPEKIKGKMPR